jgi:hypothetical protein
MTDDVLCVFFKKHMLAQTFFVTIFFLQLALLKSCFVPLTLFNLASRTSQSTTNPDAICLPFGCCVTRKLPNK